MKISLQSAQSTTPTDITGAGVDEIVRRIGAQLGAVEEVIDWGKQYQGVIVAKVVQCAKHPNADKLSVCLVDDGGVVGNVPRDDNGLVQVVCGAPNVQTGQTVVWLPPGVTVPSTFNSADPFVLDARELRGIVSNGMIASASELGISDDHDGILVIDEAPHPGTPFTQLYQLNDTIIDLENKMFTHRPDCFGTIGVARELAGIQQQQFVSPDWYKNAPVFDTATTKPLSIAVQTSLVPRFSAVVVDKVTIGPSPTWLQADLVKVGMRPINNIVDITNWVMHMTGQPLHAYDYDKVVAVSHSDQVELIARLSKKGDTLSLLNGKSLSFDDDSTILICAGSTPVGIGGVMGGADTEVSKNTKTIVIEAATFDMYSIRKTAMKFGLFTDAVTRFNKGQSPLQTTRALHKAVTFVKEFAGGQVASQLMDHQDQSVQPLSPVSVGLKFINDRLGSSLSISECKQLLENVEFTVTINDDDLVVDVPFWRRDIHIAEDVVEEIGRMYGYDKLPINLPQRSSQATPKNAMMAFKERLRDILTAAGANELLTHSFIHKRILDGAGQSVDNALQLSNAISPDLQYYRISITPSLLDKVHMNTKAGYGTFALYEIGKTHSKKWMNDDGLPIEAQRLALVFAADAKQTTAYEGEAYYQARAYIDMIASALGIILHYVPFADDSDKITHSDTARPFMSKRSAVLRTEQGEVVGVVGEYNALAVKKFKLPEFCAGFELELDALRNTSEVTATRYIQLPKFPKVSQDITLEVDASVVCAEISDTLTVAVDKNAPNDSLVSLHLKDIYEDNGKRRYTFGLVISNYSRTLTAKEVNDLLDVSASELTGILNAVRI